MRSAGPGFLVLDSGNCQQRLCIYEGHAIRAGPSHTHGLRHAYAQTRYEELTGW